MGGGALSSKVSKLGSKEVSKRLVKHSSSPLAGEEAFVCEAKRALQMQERGASSRNNKTLSRISKFTLFTKKFNPLPEIEGKSGFTLAEVLITLGIIGIIVAILIPNAVENMTKKRIAAKVKKDYVTLSNTISRAEADYGDTASWEYKSYSELESWIKTYILPYVQYSKFCNGDCNLGGYHSLGYNPKNNNANPRRPRYTIMLNNGSIWTFYRSDTPYSHQTKVVVYVGKSLPKWKYWYAGIDAFSFIFDCAEANPHFRPFQVPSSKNGKIYYPTLNRKSIMSSKTKCGCAQNSGACYGYNIAGDYCSAVLLMDNWEFKKDYPWKRY